MVSLGDNLIGSQFFLTLGSDLTSLDGQHCVIGQVTEGLDILRHLNDAICDLTHRPYQDIRITHTVVLDDPFENPRGFMAPSRSPSPSSERLQGGRIGADEDIDDTEGKTEQEIHEMLMEREAKARATILEIVGDLPDADVAPPENVLFVCKLNPVTSDDDLEIIFSRFGKVKGCEVIRDRTTGDSLQYAFVEFEDSKACENAYFKMDNVLIDDRRIHCDFSQSVAKVQWKGKGRGLVWKDGGNSNRLNFNDLKGKNNSETGRNQRDRLPNRRVISQGTSERRNSRDRRTSKSPPYNRAVSKRDHQRESHQHERKRRPTSRSRSGDRREHIKRLHSGSRSPNKSGRGRRLTPRSRSRDKNVNEKRPTSRSTSRGQQVFAKRQRSRSRSPDGKNRFTSRYGRDSSHNVDRRDYRRGNAESYNRREPLNRDRSRNDEFRSSDVTRRRKSSQDKLSYKKQKRSESVTSDDSSTPRKKSKKSKSKRKKKKSKKSRKVSSESSSSDSSSSS